jgi:hypothetical protein
MPTNAEEFNPEIEPVHETGCYCTVCLFSSMSCLIGTVSVVILHPIEPGSLT